MSPMSPFLLHYIRWVIGGSSGVHKATPLHTLTRCVDAAYSALTALGWSPAAQQEGVFQPSALGADFQIGYERLPQGQADAFIQDLEQTPDFFCTGLANLGSRGKNFAGKPKLLVRASAPRRFFLFRCLAEEAPP
jgi:hypothetical protein